MITLARRLLLLLIGALALIALGQQPTLSAEKAYQPALGDFMLSVQARHAKVWLAGNAGNWPLAEYELDEMKETLEDAAKLVPDLKGVPIGKMIETIAFKPIDDLDEAIKARDRARFISAFDKVTEACNSCHQGANKAFIVVQRPSGTGPFPNQSFAPRK